MITLPQRLLTIILFGLVTFFSFGTYFYNYSNPQQLFWDENYHLTSAQKYLNGIFFMQSHPPLGKLLIAFGEQIFDKNPVDDQFIGMDYARELPEGFSFTGYRFFPALLGWLAAPVIFLIFLYLLQRPWIAFFFTFPYIFDNAMIVHSRGAMLESPLLFFTALSILGFVLALRFKEKQNWLVFASALYGIGLGCAFGTKLVALILILLGPVGAFLLLPKWNRAIAFTIASALGFLISTFFIWHIHFALGRIVNPQLENSGFYRSSQITKDIIADGKTGTLTAFPILLWDNLRFAGPSNTGVPVLDLCKPGENGSPTIFWPLGARSINYRWNTPDGKDYQYLYLQANPVAWGIGLLGLITSGMLLMSSLFLGTPKWNARMTMISIFGGMYIWYMISMIGIEQERVMYLYHYFTPLLFSFIMAGLAFMELKQIGTWKLDDRHQLIAAMVLGGATVLSFIFYSPFTYYKLIDDAAFKRRMIFPLWDLRCVNCPQRDHFYIQK